MELLPCMHFSITRGARVGACSFEQLSSPLMTLVQKRVCHAQTTCALDGRGASATASAGCRRPACTRSATATPARHKSHSAIGWSHGVMAWRTAEVSVFVPGLLEEQRVSAQAVPQNQRPGCPIGWRWLGKPGGRPRGQVIHRCPEPSDAGFAHVPPTAHRSRRMRAQQEEDATAGRRREERWRDGVARARATVRSLRAAGHHAPADGGVQRAERLLGLLVQPQEPDSERGDEGARQAHAALDHELRNGEDGHVTGA